MHRPPEHPGDPDYSLLEELLHSASHGLGAILSVAGMVVLIALSSRGVESTPHKVAAVSLYGTTLVLLYTASTLYHGTRHPRLKRAFRVLDHCAIYTLIAGTYTPFLMVNLQDSLGEPLLAVIWTLAVAGIALKLWRPWALGGLHMAIYLLMGWLILVAAGELDDVLSLTGLGLLIAGGASYSLGIVFFAVRAIPFNHTIWHLCVMGGSTCHFFAVVTDVLPFPP
ncbi:PAQR family membrane homeostasis protein TrhA [Halomonas nitroreducens]|uniref:Hemolysin III family protein n=1 Tax=Halomonas nitroreducens TaxID=447425 RepID=A0A431V6R5_9GAMM|nr:hemolysin III family protein [Halomonas nitroreducens]RTR05594.1 hemolysin III family protein [Halomonas nitroreducens]